MILTSCIVSYTPSQFKSWFMSIFSIFYLGQGYSLGSLVLLLPLYIRNEMGKSYTEAVTISTLIITPWFVKFLFGLISDNYPIGKFGRRKPYLIIATVFSAIGWATLGGHTEPNVLFFLSGFALALGSALADSVIDGQIVEITPMEYAGRAQGVAWGSRGLGLGMAASISPLLVDDYGWNTMFFFAAIFGIGISIVVLILPQIRYQVAAQVGSKLKRIFSELKQILLENKEYQFKTRIQFMLLTGSVIAVIPLLPIIMEREFQFGYRQIGYGSIIFAVGSLIGSLLIGVIFDRDDSKKNYKIMVFVLAVVILSSLIFHFSNSLFLQLFFLFSIGSMAGGFEAYQLKVIQESSSKNHEGTIFSIYTSMSNIGQFIVGGWLIVALSELLNIKIFLPMILLIIPLFLTILPLSRFKFNK